MAIFQNPQHQKQFDRDGYIVLKVFDDAAIKAMQDFFEKTTGEGFSGFHNTLELDSPVVKNEIFVFLQGIFEQYLHRFFSGYRILGAGYVTKKSDNNSRVYPHQDWTFVDESQHTSLNLWAPLVDTNTENGALKVFKGTHKLKPSMRGSNLPPVFMISDNKVMDYLTPLYMKAGEVVMYDHRLLHGSDPNSSGKTRVAASFNIIPERAQPIHYLGDKHNLSTVKEIRVDEDFYNNYLLDKTKIGDPKANYVVNYEGYAYTEVPFKRALINEQDIFALYASAKPFFAALADKIFRRA